MDKIVESCVKKSKKERKKEKKEKLKQVNLKKAKKKKKKKIGLENNRDSLGSIENMGDANHCG